MRCGCTKSDALLIKKDLVSVHNKNNRGKTIEELSEASKVPLRHMFNSLDNSSADWCFKTRASEEGKTYNKKDDGLGCKQKDNQLYNILKKNILLFQTDNVLKESLHIIDTPKN